MCVYFYNNFLTHFEKKRRREREKDKVTFHTLLTGKRILFDERGTKTQPVQSV